ncbi:MAG TPA: sugar-binding protein [Bryobacteraceae bacterium]|nr:sugar-binding protein [Bryobacteraceae bacterium]
MSSLFCRFTALLLLLACAPAARPAEVKRARTERAAGPVRIDGVLDDEVWQRAQPIGEFTQADPYPGKPPTEQTEVRLAFDENALYMAIRCFDSQPEKILSTTMARDGRPYDDDNLEIVIDPYRDRRSGYYFQMNAAGSLSDGRIIENRLADVSWDGIWDARTRIYGGGWIAEIEIPFKTLSFRPGSGAWGFNIERTIARVNEESRWEGYTLDSSIHAVSRAGDIEGLEGLSQGIGLDIKPYGLLGYNRDIARRDRVQPKREAGADIFYRVTPNLLSSTTLNTDFAETEVDTRQVNLTRFPLFFPEKRAFFLEEAGVFQFGLPASGNNLLPFFSRRIGLVGGETVPILFGEKLTGKVGRLEMGLLDVMTRDSDAAPGQNFVVGRAKYGFWRQSYIGGIFTNGDPSGRSGNSVGGVDVLLATNNFLGRHKNFDVAAFGLKTSAPGVRSGDFAYGGQVRYPNDRISIGYSWQEIGANFDPKLGYVRRRGVRINSLNSRFGPRPKGNPHIRQVTFDFDFSDHYSTVHRSLESRTYSFSPFGLLLSRGQLFEYNLSHDTEQIFRPFEIHKDIRIPAGSYSFTRHSLSYQGPVNRPVSYGASYNRGGFYSGTSDEVTGRLSWRKSERITASLEVRQYWVRLKEGRFDTSLALVRLNYFFSPRLALTNFVQYDTDSRNIGLQSRLRWIIRPGQEVYLVLNHEWQENPLDRFEASRTDLRAKLNYTFRF